MARANQTPGVLPCISPSSYVPHVAWKLRFFLRQCTTFFIKNKFRTLRKLIWIDKNFEFVTPYGLSISFMTCVHLSSSLPIRMHAHALPIWILPTSRIRTPDFLDWWSLDRCLLTRRYENTCLVGDSNPYRRVKTPCVWWVYSRVGLLIIEV